MKAVYHCKSSKAVISILAGKKLRFTDCEFLNDQKELSYCYDLNHCAWVEACRASSVSERYINHAITAHANSYEWESPYRDFLYCRVAARYFVLCANIRDDFASLWACYARDADAFGNTFCLNMDVRPNSFGCMAQQSMGIDRNIDAPSSAVYSDADRRMVLFASRINSHMDELCVSRKQVIGAVDQVTKEEISRGVHLAHSLASFIIFSAFCDKEECRVVLNVAERYAPCARDELGSFRFYSWAGWVELTRMLPGAEILCWPNTWSRRNPLLSLGLCGGYGLVFRRRLLAVHSHRVYFGACCAPSWVESVGMKQGAPACPERLQRSASGALRYMVEVLGGV